MTLVERLLLHGSVWIATLTGAVFWIMKYRMRTDDPFSAIHHPWQPHVLALHLLIVPLLVFVLGWIVPVHVLGRLGEAKPRARTSGLIVIVLAAPMILSGYGMQVVTGETTRIVLADVHALCGLLFAGLFLGHAISGARRRNGANGRRAGGVRQGLAIGHHDGGPARPRPVRRRWGRGYTIRGARAGRNPPRVRERRQT